MHDESSFTTASGRAARLLLRLPPTHSDQGDTAVRIPSDMLCTLFRLHVQRPTCMEPYLLYRDIVHSVQTAAARSPLFDTLTCDVTGLPLAQAQLWAHSIHRGNLSLLHAMVIHDAERWVRELLVKQVIDPNAIDTHGRTALFYSSSARMTATLLHHNASVSVLDRPVASSMYPLGVTASQLERLVQVSAGVTGMEPALAPRTGIAECADVATGDLSAVQLDRLCSDQRTAILGSELPVSESAISSIRTSVQSSACSVLALLGAGAEIDQEQQLTYSRNELVQPARISVRKAMRLRHVMIYQMCQADCDVCS